MSWPLPAAPLVAPVAATAAPAPVTPMIDPQAWLTAIAQANNTETDKKQSYPPHVLRNLARICGVTTPDPTHNDLPAFWRQFRPYKGAKISEVRLFVEEFMAKTPAGSFKSSVAFSTRLLKALKEANFGGTSNWVDRFDGISPFSVVAEEYVTNAAGIRSAMQAYEETADNERASDRFQANALRMEAQPPLTRLELHSVTKTLAGFCYQIFSVKCPLIPHLSTLMTALDDFRNFTHYSRIDFARILWRLHFAMRKYLNGEDEECKLFVSLISGIELQETPTNKAPPELMLMAGPTQPPPQSYGYPSQWTPPPPPPPRMFPVPPPPAPHVPPQAPHLPPMPAPRGPPAVNQAPYAARFGAVFLKARSVTPGVRIGALLRAPGAPFPTLTAVLGPDFCLLCSPDKPEPCARFHLLGECPDSISCPRCHQLTGAPSEATILQALARFEQAVAQYIAHPPKKQKK